MSDNNTNIPQEPPVSQPQNSLSSLLISDSAQPTADNGGVGYLGGYVTGSALDLMYGANDPSVIASQFIQGGEMFRLQRGYPYKRAGHMVPVLPQFKTQNIVIPNLASQPQANSSAAQIVQPTADKSTTNANTGSTPFIGIPGFNRVNLT